MTTEEIEKLARDGKQLPQYTTLPDACYYEAVTSLWERYRAGHIDRDTAHAQKMQLIRRYHEFRAAYENCCAVYRERQDNIRKLGALRTEIAREPDERQRLRLCIQAIGAMTGDEVFAKTQIERLEESHL